MIDRGHEQKLVAVAVLTVLGLVRVPRADEFPLQGVFRVRVISAVFRDCGMDLFFVHCL